MTAPTLRVAGELAACDDARPESTAPSVAMNGAAMTLFRRRRWRVLVGCLLAALFVVEAGLVGPDLAGALRSFSGANAGWVVVATVAAAASMNMFARVRCRLLGAAGVAVTLRGCVAAVYVANSLQATLPGGAPFPPATASGGCAAGALAARWPRGVWPRAAGVDRLCGRAGVAGLAAGGWVGQRGAAHDGDHWRARAGDGCPLPRPAS